MANRYAFIFEPAGPALVTNSMQFQKHLLIGGKYVSTTSQLDVLLLVFYSELTDVLVPRRRWLGRTKQAGVPDLPDQLRAQPLQRPGVRCELPCKSERLSGQDGGCRTKH